MTKPHLTISAKSTLLKAVIPLILLTACLRAGAMSFTPDVITWETHSFQHRTLLVDADEMGKWYTLGLPRDWSYRFLGPAEMQYVPDKTLASVTMRIASSAEKFPGFWEEDDIKFYARELVSNLPEDVESRGKIKKGGRWLSYNNWSTLSLTIDYVQYGNKMKMGMGFCINPENRNEQLRWIINCREGDYDEIRKKFRIALNSWRMIDQEEKNTLESGEIVMD
jgi:hypothetical protein